MKLRNKKTGEIAEGYVRIGIQNNGKFPNPIEYHTCISFAELNEEWEDYKPKEPLIKDEKIRKAVRAWAEANGIGGCICKEEIHCITFETERGMFISFENADPIPPEGNFTITELCGEEE